MKKKRKRSSTAARKEVREVRAGKRPAKKSLWRRLKKRWKRGFRRLKRRLFPARAKRRTELAMVKGTKQRSLFSSKGLYILGIPMLAAFLCIYVLPIFITGWYSMLENSFSKAFVGIENYISMWNNKIYLLGLKNTLLITLALMGTASLVSIVLGYCIFKNPKIGKIGYAVLLLPLLAPSAAVTMVWREVFNTSSFSSAAVSYGAIISLFVWKYSGTGAMILGIGLEDIPKDILQAAALDGAGSVRTYWSICLPCILRHVALMALFFLMFAFRIYKECYLLFDMYPSESIYLIQHYMNNHFLKLNYQYVASSAISLSGISVLGYAVLYGIMRKGRRVQQ